MMNILVNKIINIVFREQMKKSIKAKDSYGLVFDRVKAAVALQQKQQHLDNTNQTSAPGGLADSDSNQNIESQNNALIPYQPITSINNQQLISPAVTSNQSSVQLIPKKAPTIPKPKWHAPWKLYRVISGHLGWVRSVAVEPGNEWFVTGAADRVIKVWDLASGKLKLSLTGKYEWHVF